jgi:hypothetical protein
MFPIKEAVSPRYLKASNSDSDFLTLNKPKMEHFQLWRRILDGVSKPNRLNQVGRLHPKVSLAAKELFR